MEEDDRITWRTRREDGAILLYRGEPTGSFRDHFKAAVLAILPIGAQL